MGMHAKPLKILKISEWSLNKEGICVVIMMCVCVCVKESEREVCEAPPPPTLHMLFGSHTLWLENLLELTKQQCVGHRAHLCRMTCAQCQKCLFHEILHLREGKHIHYTVGGPSVHFPPQMTFFVYNGCGGRLLMYSTCCGFYYITLDTQRSPQHIILNGFDFLKRKSWIFFFFL